MTYDHINELKFLVNYSTTKKRSIKKADEILKKIEKQAKKENVTVKDYIDNHLLLHKTLRFLLVRVDEEEQEAVQADRFESEHGLTRMILWFIMLGAEKKRLDESAEIPIDIINFYINDEEQRDSYGDVVQEKTLRLLVFFVAPFNPVLTSMFRDIKQIYSNKINIRHEILTELLFLPPRGTFRGGKEYHKARKNFERKSIELSAST